MDINKKISHALNDTDIPVLRGWYDSSLQVTHITYLIFNNSDTDYLDDEATSEEIYIQMDIWTLDESQGDILRKKIKKLMKDEGFLFLEGNDQPFEPDTKIFHYAQRFYIKDYY